MQDLLIVFTFILVKWAFLVSLQKLLVQSEIANAE